MCVGDMKMGRQRKCAYNHEPWGDCPLTHSKNEAGGEQATETLAGGMSQQSNCPNEDVDAWMTISLEPLEKILTNLIHFPTGHLWRAKLWG
jgi:hypothetical protein